ncbi:hypothetical protein D0T53_10010 [Dysgonomonas sp. 216]|uniref:hypothetical protein n=1 Tax=Dysgonomonas sp. 216 TaxID=2302934 RepID=UPI0013D4E23D|nr:hypothetical protein [Dysgonomonas sp. 216]NDW19246.1 hypothetical protein [Dysgonomonas sp. 216]
MKDTLISDHIVVLKDTIAQVNHSITFNANPDSDNQLITNVITILLALVAALIALYQVKSNVISSARITWIENLRCALSEYSAEVINCAMIITNMREKCLGVKKEEIDMIIDKHYSSYVESANLINRLSCRVLLYLNAKEDKHQQIEKCIDKIEQYLHEKNNLKSDNRAAIEEQLNEIVKLSKLIFKEEWDKSKKIFRI